MPGMTLDPMYQATWDGLTADQIKEIKNLCKKHCVLILDDGEDWIRLAGCDAFLKNLRGEFA